MKLGEKREAITRKLQAVKGAYLITLPKNWVKRQGLEKGELVGIKERQDGSLLISASSAFVPEESEISVMYPVKGFSISDLVTGLYLMGYDRMEIKWRAGSIPHPDREKVRSLVRRLSGIEISEETEDKISIRCVIDPLSMKPKMILRRMGFLVRSMIQNLSNVSGNIDNLESIVASDDDVDRAYFLLVRLLRSALRRPSLMDNLELAPMEYLDYRVAAELIEIIGDKVSIIAREAIDETTIARALGRMSQDVSYIGSEIIEPSVSAFISRGANKAEAIRREIDEFERKVHLALNETKPRRRVKQIGFDRALIFMKEVLDSCKNILDLIGPSDSTGSEI